MQSSPIKLISLNIEMDKHLDRVIPFLKKENADVILLQEVLGKDRALFESALQMHGVYTPQNLICLDTGEHPIGLFTLTHLPMDKHYPIFYKGQGDPLIRMTIQEPEKMERAILVTRMLKDEKSYWFVNTHFTWSANAQATEAQDRDLEIMLSHLAKMPECILCGDFNAPRGARIFDTLAERYQDNIPPNIKSTLDKNFHKAGDLAIVVDGVFTTPHYAVQETRVVEGVSDHCAIVTTLRAQD